MLQKARRALLAMLCIGAAALVLAACGDSDDDSGTAAATAPAETAAADTQAAAPSDEEGSGGLGEESVTDYVAYVGGTAGPADESLPPVTIGWVNQEGGQEEIGAAATQGAELAVKVLNEKLGGINGHPVKLEKCFIRDAEEEGTTCAQKLVNNPDVKVIVMGGVAIGIESFYSTIAGKKPVITGVA
ncbi:MAG TPA: ABC transporter substrate-binding protein, partial [Capillimicrobium sp.]|nr:ABC transporter substrate-binding protein [Capillimicrobium sp.]